jgi:nitrate/TMAO reductase-like tetraheme cytochrome c subunit
MDSQSPHQNQDAACERCGSFDAMEFADQMLCADCIQLAGCGCAGHGSDED